MATIGLQLRPRKRTRNHPLAIGVELLAIEMCVRIYEHGRWSSVVGPCGQKTSNL
jgi:hypothetical protein